MSKAEAVSSKPADLTEHNADPVETNTEPAGSTVDLAKSYLDLDPVQLTVDSVAADHASDKPVVDSEQAPDGPELSSSSPPSASGTRPDSVSKPDKSQNPYSRSNRPTRNSTRFVSQAKFDASKLEPSDDPVQIRTQVEFYFGDYNFPSDKFMWEQAEGTANKPIALKTLCNFSRMKHFQPYSAVVAALRDSSLLDIEGADGDEMVKRKVAYTLSLDRSPVDPCSVYVKGFGTEGPTTQFDIEAFFTQFGPIQGVRLRRDNDKLFKGSVFVQFQDIDRANTFLQLEPKPTWQGNDLKIMTKQAYCDEKSGLIRAGKIVPNPITTRRFFEGKGDFAGSNGRGRGRGRGRFVARAGRHDFKGDRTDWKGRRDHDQHDQHHDRKHNHKNDNRNDHRNGRGGHRRGGGERGNRRDNPERTKPTEPTEHVEPNPNGVSPGIQTASDPKDPKRAETSSSSGQNGKRQRDAADNAVADAPAVKKVDAKPAAATADA